MIVSVREFFDKATSTLTYVVYDEEARDAVIIDPLLDYDSAASHLSCDSAMQVLRFVETTGLRVHAILETHAHADHISGSQWLKARLGARIGIGRRICEVQAAFHDRFELPDAGRSIATDGSQFDFLVSEGDTIKAGSLDIRVIETPGHTPACVTYCIGDAIFVGDAMFIEDYGTGRCDFPGGDAATLYKSLHSKLFHLPPETRVFVGHDYQPGGRPLRFCTTISAEKDGNVQLNEATSLDSFVAFRRARDATLNQPRLLWPSIRINIDAGHIPPADADGQRRLTVPLTIGDELRVAADA